MDHPPQPRDRNVRLFRNETLGSGSYGVVCRAMWGQRLCAAKLLHPIFFQSNDPGIATTRRRFEQECHFLNDMKHPNIVEYLGTSHDPDSGLLVLLMELMDESLTHLLERSQQPLAYHIVVDLCHDIAQALAYIHSKEIIHRDLSGNNILLIAGKAKITDFGMSKLLDVNRRMTPLTMCPGTLAYMPPEALGDPPIYSKKIDCFSFGVLQIQIMTHQFPDPGPAMQVVEDPRSPTGTTNMPVLDSERRKSHIDLIDPTHALLPTALSCLGYLEKDRPTAQDLCQQLATIKETSRYMQLAHLREQNEEQGQHIQQLHQQLQTLQHELQTKDQQLQDSQRCMETLQQELQERNQQLIQQMEEKQRTIDNRETQILQLNKQLQANEQITAEFQHNLLQHEQTIRQLQATVRQMRQDLQQAVVEKQAAERQLQEPNQQLIATKQVKAQTITPQLAQVAITRPQDAITFGQVLHPAQHVQVKKKQHVSEGHEGQAPKLTQQLQSIKQKAAQPQKALMQQKTIRDMKWRKEFKAPEKMDRGSAASDSNMAYFNGGSSAKVYSYDSDTQKWHQLPDIPHAFSTLVVVQHILTTVGGYLNGKVTNSLLSLMKTGRAMKWLTHFPAMPTARRYTAVVYSGHSLIVAGGSDISNRLADVTVEVLDTDTQRWSTAYSLPHPISLAPISICGQRLYLIDNNSNRLGTRSVFTCSIPELLQSCQTQPSAGKLQTAPANQSTIWRRVADAPHYYSTCATLCGQLVAVGGEERLKATAAICAYDEATDSWEAVGDMPTARYLALVAILNGKLIVVGGRVRDWVVTETDVAEILC